MALGVISKKVVLVKKIDLRSRLLNNSLLESILDGDELQFVGSHDLEEGKILVHGSGIYEYVPNEDFGSSYDFIYSCAVHGNETAPIEIIDELFTEILTENFVPRCRCLFIVANFESIRIGKRFVSENLNRLFNGKWKEREENGEVLRARELEKYVRLFCESSTKELIHYDLHTAIKPSKYKTFAIYPVGTDNPDQFQMKLLKEAGIRVALVTRTSGTTFSAFTKESFNSHSFTLELGKVKPFGENNPEDFKATSKLLRRLLVSDTSLTNLVDEVESREVVRQVLRSTEEEKLLTGDDLENFTTLAKGTEIKSGDFLEEDLQIIFPNSNVAVGQRMCLLIK